MRTLRFCLIALCTFLLMNTASLPMNMTVRAQGGRPPIKKGTIAPVATPQSGLKRELPPQYSGISPAAAPSNDDFSAAFVIPSFSYQHATNTVQATTAADDPQMGCGLGTNSNTVWYRITPAISGFAEADTFGSNYDTVLTVFTGNRGALTRIVCNDDVSGVSQSQVAFEVVAGQTYYLEVADYGAAGGGQLSFNVNMIAPSILNSYLRSNVFFGQFVIGTTGGDPSTTLDNNKRLLFGYPWLIGSSYTTLRVINGSTTTDYRLGLIGIRRLCQRAMA